MSSPPQVSTDPYPAAIAIGFLSLLITLIIIPPFCTHLRNRNLPASVLVLCAIYANFQTFLNAVIWPHDNRADWFNGVGLCDVENKLQVVLQSAFPASVAMVLRALARVMDTNSANWSLSTKAKRKDLIIDWTCCVVVPLLQIISGFVVQPFRSYIFGIAGCVSPGDGTWLFFLLMVVPPALWTLLAVFYAALTLRRLLLYRASFNTLLANSCTTKSRFLRLYLLCTLIILIWLPIQIYVIIQNNPKNLVEFVWNDTHHPTAYKWSTVIMTVSGGKVYYDRWVWLAGGASIFGFFGWGRDAVKLYREGLKKVGLGKMWPSLTSRGNSTVGGANSVTSRAKLLLEQGKRKMSWTSTSTLTSNTTTLNAASPSRSSSAAFSPKKSEFMETIGEAELPLHHTDLSRPQQTRPRPNFTLSSLPLRHYPDTAPTPPHHSRTSSWLSRFVPEFLQPSTYARQDSMSTDPFVLSNISPRKGGSVMQSRVVAEPPSPTTVQGQREREGKEEVRVKKEFRVGSESV